MYHFLSECVLRNEKRKHPDDEYASCVDHCDHSLLREYVALPSSVLPTYAGARGNARPLRNPGIQCRIGRDLYGRSSLTTHQLLFAPSSVPVPGTKRRTPSLLEGVCHFGLDRTESRVLLSGGPSHREVPHGLRAGFQAQRRVLESRTLLSLRIETRSEEALARNTCSALPTNHF